MKWLTITDSLRGAIRTTSTIDPMSHVGDMELGSEMWKRFESLYRDSGFIEHNTIFMRLSTQTLSDFDNVAQFADTIKRNSIRLKEIGTTDVPDWMYTSWFLHGLSSKYDSFRMMLTNNRKAAQAKGGKEATFEPDFDSILEQILNLDTQNKSSESRFMKSSSKPNESKKSAGPTPDACPYCNKGGQPEDKCYYKHPERASESFPERFKTRIADLKARNASTARVARKKDTESTLDLRDCGFMVRGKPLAPASILATGGHDRNWYFDNAASYYMSFDINDFDIAHDMRPCVSPQDDITLADGSFILPDGIGKVWFHFEFNNKAEPIFLSDVRYCKKLDTKLISLGMLDRKGLTYSAGGGVLTVKNKDATVMTGQLDLHNLYRVNLATVDFLPPKPDRAMTATTSPSAADITTWHRRFAHLNTSYLKHLPSMTTGMKILQGFESLPFCKTYVQSNMTRQPPRDLL